MKRTLNRLSRAEVLRHQAETLTVMMLWELHKPHPDLAKMRCHAEKLRSELTALHRAQDSVRNRTWFLLEQLAQAKGVL